MAPSTEAITGSLPRERQGVASALNDVTREFGTALGVALPGALLSAGYRDAVDDRFTGSPRGDADAAREGIANAVEAADGAGPTERRSSTPPGSPSSTAGNRPCGRVSS